VPSTKGLPLQPIPMRRAAVAGDGRGDARARIDRELRLRKTPIANQL